MRRATEQDWADLVAERSAWREEFLQVDPSRLIFLDETSTNTAMDRTNGRATSGKRVDGPVPHGHWQATTLTAAVRLDGVVLSACIASDRPTDAAFFQDYVWSSLVPALRPGVLVIMDNLASHKSTAAIGLIEASGATVRFLPAYSPDLNPIEAMFSKLKTVLRRTKAHTFETLIEALGVALGSITAQDIRSWFGHSGYQTAASSGTPGEKPL